MTKTAAEVWARLPLSTRLWLQGADIWLNVRYGGLAGETLSERAAWAKSQASIGAAVCDALDRIDPGHSIGRDYRETSPRGGVMANQQNIGIDFLPALTAILTLATTSIESVVKVFDKATPAQQEKLIDFLIEDQTNWRDFLKLFKGLFPKDTP